jgi:hypothetical protein
MRVMRRPLGEDPKVAETISPLRDVMIPFNSRFLLPAVDLTMAVRQGRVMTVDVVEREVFEAGPVIHGSENANQLMEKDRYGIYLW